MATATQPAPEAMTDVPAPDEPTPGDGKKKRAKAKYVVQRSDKDDKWLDVMPVSDTRLGHQWIAKQSVDGHTYRVARITFGPVKVHTQTLTKRILQ